MAWARGFCCPADSDLGDPDGSDCHAFGGQMACVEVMCVCVYGLATGGFNSLWPWSRLSSLHVFPCPMLLESWGWQCVLCYCDICVFSPLFNPRVFMEACFCLCSSLQLLVKGKFAFYQTWKCVLGNQSSLHSFICGSLDSEIPMKPKHVLIRIHIPALRQHTAQAVFYLCAGWEIRLVSGFLTRPVTSDEEGYRAA